MSRGYLHIIFSCVLFFGFIGCSNSIADKVQHIRSKGLNINSELHTESIRDVFTQTTPKIVTFIDGRCNVCLDDLRLWHQLQQDSIINTLKIPVIYYIGAENKESIQIWLRLYKLDYMVIDKKKDLLRSNGLDITDKQIHTFLLDNNNKVVLVGSPINNPRMWTLYKSTITQLQTSK